MKNPSMFIVGCPRSGTTLLCRIVSAHPQIVIQVRSMLASVPRGVRPYGVA